MLGLHDYDGLLPDVSSDRLKGWADKAIGLLERIKDEFHELDKEGRQDAQSMETMLERMLFEIQDLRAYSTRPTIHALQLSATPYISREYAPVDARIGDRKSTRLNSSHSQISYAVFCLKKKTKVVDSA